VGGYVSRELSIAGRYLALARGEAVNAQALFFFLFNHQSAVLAVAARYKIPFALRPGLSQEI